MRFELRKEDLELISKSLESEEIKCLPQAYQIMQKIVGAVDKEPGRADLVDSIKAVAATIDKLISETKDIMGNRKVGFIKVMQDMLKYVGNWFWLIVVGSFPVVILVVLYCDMAIDPKKLPETLVNIIPEIMGFLIAGLAIIMGFNEGTLKLLSKNANDGEIPLKVIIASFSICLLILLATLVVSTMYVNFTFTCIDCKIMFCAFVLYGAVISVESIIHVIFHLFATGTYLIIK